MVNFKKVNGYVFNQFLKCLVHRFWWLDTDFFMCIHLWNYDSFVWQYSNWHFNKVFSYLIFLLINIANIFQLQYSYYITKSVDVIKLKSDVFICLIIQYKDNRIEFLITKSNHNDLFCFIRTKHAQLIYELAITFKWNDNVMNYSFTQIWFEIILYRRHNR